MDYLIYKADEKPKTLTKVEKVIVKFWRTEVGDMFLGDKDLRNDFIEKLVNKLSVKQIKSLTTEIIAQDKADRKVEDL